LPQAGVQRVQNFVYLCSVGSRPNGSDTPACGKLLARYLSFWDSAVRLGSEENRALLKMIVTFGKQI